MDNFKKSLPYQRYSSEFAVCLLLNINAFLIKLPGAYFYLSKAPP